MPLQILHTLPSLPGHPCAYLAGRIARDRGFAVSHLNSATWGSLLESGWRRAGAIIYEPACPMCRECIPIRIPIGRFSPSRSQRRARARNADLTVRLTPVAITDERAELYRKYITTRHNGMMSGSRREFEQFVGASPVDTCELECRLGRRLVSVGTIDRTPAAWNCVYCYFDPELSWRSLGTFNVLQAIELCGDHCPAGNEAHIYLGYWIAGSKTMAYKTNFRPHELRTPSGAWVRSDGASRSASGQVHSNLQPPPSPIFRI